MLRVLIRKACGTASNEYPQNIIEAAHDKTNKLACAPSED